MSLLDRLKGDPRQRFAKQVLEAVRQTDVARSWIDDDKFAIGFERQAGGAPGWIFLDTTFKECEGESEEYTEHRIANLVAATVNQPSLPDTWAGVRPQLRPVLRGATFGMGAPAPMENKLLARPALPYLNELVVLDTPTTMAYVMQESLPKWGVTPEEVFSAARENLAAMAALSDDDSAGPRILRFFDDGDAYFVSRILLPGWLAGCSGPVGGTPVAFVPDNNTLVVMADGDAVGPFAELVEKEYQEAARSISPQPYTVDGSGSVIPYPTSHPAARRAGIVLAANEYASQKHWLEQEHERDGTDIYVAEFMVPQRQDGSLFSCTVWSRNVDTLLPRTEFVAFAAEDELTFFVPWEILASELAPADGFYPARFRVSAWPEPAVLEGLKAAAVEP